MKGQAFAILKDVRGKVSSQNKKYHEITFEEVQEKTTDGFERPKVIWENMYYPDVVNHDHLVSMIGQKVTVDLNIYTTSRRVGDSVYQDIKSNVICVALIPEPKAKN